MPLLGGLLVSLFSGIASFFVQYVTKKVAFGLAAAAMFTTLTGGLFLLMRTTVAQIAGGATLTGQLAMFFCAAVPPIAPACIGAITTVWAGCALYKWQTKALDMFTKA